jgi:hypothetical protein
MTMSSADFRIIPHQVAEAVNPAHPDLYRYLISYASTNQPQFAALDEHGRMVLVSDEKEAVRFGSIEAAEKRLAYAIETGEFHP